MASWTLTSHLLSLDKPAFIAATQSPFLAAAGQGLLPKPVLSTWLANDRLYIHAYIKTAGRVLSIINLPQQTYQADNEAAPQTQLVDWLITTLTALRREERLFIDVARRYGLDIDLETDLSNNGTCEVRCVPDSAKIPGLVMFEQLFGALHPASSVNKNLPLPWLEAAVVFWGTERVYLDAWTWAKAQQSGGGGHHGERDEDGGALRRELIPNWSNEGFAEFVENLAEIVDRAALEAVSFLGEGVKADLMKRAEKVWKELLTAEAAFWPDLR
ncbi:unnamed protein product [Discula destructiva]